MRSWTDDDSILCTFALPARIAVRADVCNIDDTLDCDGDSRTNGVHDSDGIGS